MAIRLHSKPERVESSPEDSSVGTTPPPRTPLPKGQQKALVSVRRELTEEEFASPASRRMLLAELERLQEENGGLRDYQEKYHEADKQVAVLTEERSGQDRLLNALSKRDVSQDITFGVCLTIGAGILGPPPWEASDWPTSMIGILFIIGGILSKWWQRDEN